MAAALGKGRGIPRSRPRGVVRLAAGAAEGDGRSGAVAAAAPVDPRHPGDGACSAARRCRTSRRVRALGRESATRNRPASQASAPPLRHATAHGPSFCATTPPREQGTPGLHVTPRARSAGYRPGRSTRRPCALAQGRPAAQPRPRGRSPLRGARRRCGHHRRDGGRAPDVARPRGLPGRSRAAGLRQHGGEHGDAAMGDRPVADRAHQPVRLRARGQHLPAKPAGGDRAEGTGRSRAACPAISARGGRSISRAATAPAPPSCAPSTRCASAPACRASISTIRPCCANSASRARRRSSRRARPMPIRCAWPIRCSRPPSGAAPRC